MCGQSRACDGCAVHAWHSHPARGRNDRAHPLAGDFCCGRLKGDVVVTDHGAVEDGRGDQGWR